MSLQVHTVAAGPGDGNALNTGDSPGVPPTCASIPLGQQPWGNDPAANRSVNDVAGTVAQNNPPRPLPVLAQGQGDPVAVQDEDVDLNRHLKRCKPSSPIAAYYLPSVTFRIITGIGAAVILITASAMKAAGCTYEDIKWPVTIEITILTAFLTPTYASIIA